MNQVSVSQFQKDLRFEGYLLVKMGEQRQGANGSKYLDMTLCDKTGEMNAKMWDGTIPPPSAGSIIKVRCTVQEYNGRLQLRVERLRNVTDQDDVELQQLMPCAPEKPESMLSEIMQTVNAMKSNDLRTLVSALIEKCKDQLMYYPAAQRLHHAQRSGLLFHTVSMLRSAKALCTVYQMLDKDLLYAGVIVHDLCKISEMVSDTMGNVTDYSCEGLLLGHLVKGVANIYQTAQEVGVQGEYVLLLEHMVISHHGIPEYGSPRPPMFPEAVALHMIDDFDAKMNEMETILNRTPRGSFSEKIWSLDRRIYHPLYNSEEPNNA